MQQAYTHMKIKNNFTEEAIFIQDRICFKVCSSGTTGPPYLVVQLVTHMWFWNTKKKVGLIFGHSST